MKLSKLQLEIRLTQAEMDSSAHGASAAESEFQAIAKDARSAGYALIAANITQKRRGVCQVGLRICTRECSYYPEICSNCATRCILRASVARKPSIARQTPVNA